MAFLKEIKGGNFSLKKTVKTTKDFSIEETIVKDEEDYYRLIRETYFEKYYENIKELTFKSVIVPLSHDDIKTIYEANLEFENRTTLTKDMKEIEVKIDAAIEEVRSITSSKCSVFVRLSSRSPKDAIYHLHDFCDLYEDKLSELNLREDPFTKLHAFYKASTEALSISSGSKATELLRKSNRIQEDLKVCLERNESMKLIVRQFVEFPVKNELRAFVYKGSFTALTQYNNLAYFSEMSQVKDKMLEKVKELMMKLIDAMKPVLESFIADIVLDSEDKVWVVEVNPFGELAGSCLFRWKQDRAILKGEKPFEFRIVEEKPKLEFIKSELDPRVLKMINL